MTVEQKAEEYAKENFCEEVFYTARNAFIDGYHECEKELEAQIEKMKCCSNCKNEGDYKEPYRYGTGWCNICKRHKVAKGNFDKWELQK